MKRKETYSELRKPLHQERQKLVISLTHKIPAKSVPYILDGLDIQTDLIAGLILCFHS